MEEKQGHWYVVRMPLYEVKNIYRVSEINAKKFNNRIELFDACENLGIKDYFGMCPSINLEKLSSSDAPNKDTITFPGGHAEIRVFLTNE